MRDLEIAADYDFLGRMYYIWLSSRGEIFEVLNFCILIAK